MPCSGWSALHGVNPNNNNDNKKKWHHQINDLAVKLNRANALLFKIRNLVNQKVPRSIYFAVFYSHLNYSNLIWAQHSNTVQRIILRKSHRSNIISTSKLSFKSFFLEK